MLGYVVFLSSRFSCDFCSQISACISEHVGFISTGRAMVISFDFQRMTYAQDLTFGLRLAFGLGLEFLVALHFCLAWLPCVPVLLSCLACLPCLAALLLPVVVTLPGCLPFLPCLLSCLALPFASLCLALRCLMPWMSSQRGKTWPRWPIGLTMLT